jgi:hypothetical protein
LGVRQGRMESAEDLRRVVEESAMVRNWHSLRVCTLSLLLFRFCQFEPNSDGLCNVHTHMHIICRVILSCIHT